MTTKLIACAFGTFLFCLSVDLVADEPKDSFEEPLLVKIDRLHEVPRGIRGPDNARGYVGQLEVRKKTHHYVIGMSEGVKGTGPFN